MTVRRERIMNINITNKKLYKSEEDKKHGKL